MDIEARAAISKTLFILAPASQIGEGHGYINRVPCREAHVRATEFDFGGITECEGGGGWVSRTPFLRGNRGL